jgi:lipopolysaccharide/colanic/teichoic acid biosynthesis glycosyltransferase
VEGKGLQKALKRTFDIMVSSAALLLLSSLFLLCAGLLKLSSRGPVFYRWRIIGQNGRRITSCKFRTMVEDAEQIEIKLRQNGNNEMASVYFKLREDKRVTPVGKFLRKFSIDELPSLYSVLKGDLSLVGPRPVREHELILLNDQQKKRFAVKPGATSLWVIAGKNKISDFDEIVKLDLNYINNWSLLLDLKILLKTIPVIVLGKNY